MRPHQGVATPRNLLCGAAAPSAEPSPRWALLAHPREESKPSNTIIFDEGCLLDSPFLVELTPMVEVLSDPNDASPLWGFSYPQLTKQLLEVSRVVQKL